MEPRRLQPGEIFFTPQKCPEVKLEILRARMRVMEDQFAHQSQTIAVLAQTNKVFAEEIVRLRKQLDERDAPE